MLIDIPITPTPIDSSIDSVIDMKCLMNTVCSYYFYKCSFCAGKLVRNKCGEVSAEQVQFFCAGKLVRTAAEQVPNKCSFCAEKLVKKVFSLGTKLN